MARGKECVLAGADLAAKLELAHGKLCMDVRQRHDVHIVLALGAVAARRRLLPTLAFAQVQPAGAMHRRPCHLAVSVALQKQEAIGEHAVI